MDRNIKDQRKVEKIKRSIVIFPSRNISYVTYWKNLHIKMFSIKFLFQTFSSIPIIYHFIFLRSEFNMVLMVFHKNVLLAEFKYLKWLCRPPTKNRKPNVCRNVKHWRWSNYAIIWLVSNIEIKNLSVHNIITISFNKSEL